jgi:nucleoid DNA-binding protein
MAKKTAAAGKPLTKTQIMAQISEDTGLSKKQVSTVFDSLADVIRKELNKGRKTEDKAVTIPGLCKVVTQYKPAQKERKGINPFTGEEAIFKAKPARSVVKVRPLKALKDMA